MERYCVASFPIKRSPGHRNRKVTAKKSEKKPKSEDEADQAVSRWLVAHPTEKFIKRHPVKILPLQMLPTKPVRLIEVPDQHSVMIEFEEG